MPARQDALSLAVLLVCVSLAACYTRGTIRYRDHPDLGAVKLSQGGRHEPKDHLGVVEAEASGWEDCDTLTTDVMRDMLAEARALGGTSVVDVKFRARWHWTGRPLCRSGFLWLGKSARARGYAVKADRDSDAGL